MTNDLHANKYETTVTPLTTFIIMIMTMIMILLINDNKSEIDVRRRMAERWGGRERGEYAFSKPQDGLSAGLFFPLRNLIFFTVAVSPPTCK